MKNYKILLTAVIGLVLCGCSAIEEPQIAPDNGEALLANISFKADDVATRVVFDQSDPSNKQFVWEATDDVLGLYSTAIATQNTQLVAGTSGSFITPNPVAITSTGKQLFYLYYPYKSGATQSGNEIGGFRLPVLQGDGSDWDTYATMYARGGISADIDAADTEISLGGMMYNAMAFMRFKFKNTGSNDYSAISSIVIESACGTTLSGYYSTNIETGALTFTNDIASKVGLSELSLDGTEASTADYGTVSGLLVVPAVTFPVGDIVVRVKSGTTWLQGSFTDKSLSLSTGGVTTLGLDLANFVTAPAKTIATAYDWQNFAAMANEGDYSEYVNSDGEVALTSNITTDTQFLRVKPDWGGTFNGNGYTITQNATTTPLFTTILSSGTVKDVVLAGSQTTATYPTSLGTASLARCNYGTIEDVTNNICITLTNISSVMYTCGMVVCNAGTMTRCKQKGNINVTYNISGNVNNYVGGLAIFASENTDTEVDNADPNKNSVIEMGEFVDCTNEGDISVVKGGTADKLLGRFAMGGICAIVHSGDASTYSTFSGCSNSGTISRTDNSRSSNSTSAIGGIVGRIATYSGQDALDINKKYYAVLSGCSNSGMIINASDGTDTYKSNGTSTSARLQHTGGIVGVAYGLPAKQIDLKDCSNTGTIKGGKSIASSSLGGIMGT